MDSGLYCFGRPDTEMGGLFQTGFLYGVQINASAPEQALDEIEWLHNSGTSHYVCFFEGNLFYRSCTDADVRDVVNAASLVYPDGVAVAKCWSWHFRRKFERVTGPAMMLKICESGVSRRYRHFFLGGAPGVPEKLAANLKEQFPGLEVAGVLSPPFREITASEEDQLIERINAAAPDFLWIGLGGPKQEFWMNKHLNRLRVPVMLGVGAAFDFHSGNRSWAPPWIRKVGMEWLFRSLTGGRRIFGRNLKCVSYISLTVLREFFLRMLPLRPPVLSDEKYREMKKCCPR